MVNKNDRILIVKTFLTQHSNVKRSQYLYVICWLLEADPGDGSVVRSNKFR